MSDSSVGKEYRDCENILNDPRLDMFKGQDGRMQITEQQAKAILADGKLLISASAGAGKTSTLIKRLLLTVAEGRCSLRDMLVCVYNDSAQAELRQRLHTGLIDYAIKESDKTRRANLLKAIDDLPFCNISTIHAFCSSLIRANFDKLDISPRFEIADDARYKLLADKAMDAVFDECAASGDADFATLVEIFDVKRNEEELKGHIIKLYERMVLHEDRQKFKEALLADFENSPLQAKLLDLYKRRLKEAREVMEDAYALAPSLRPKKRVDENLALALSYIDEMLNAEDFRALLQFAARTENTATKQNVTGLDESDREIFSFARDCLKDFDSVLGELREQFANWDENRAKHAQNVRFVAKLLELTERTEAELERLKAEQNLLCYQDLLLLAAKLLGEYPELGRTFKMIFVDEYQDVDPLQESIFRRLIGDECFMVGDVKQSIYGFRLADPNIFAARREEFEASDGANVIDFNANFRSNPEILRFVNSVFNAVMTPESADLDYRREGAFDISACPPAKVLPESREQTADASCGDGGLCDEESSPSAEDGAEIPTEVCGETPREGPTPVKSSGVRVCLFYNSPPAAAPERSGVYDIVSDSQNSASEEQSAQLRLANFILSEINSLVGKAYNADLVDDPDLDDAEKRLKFSDIAILSRNSVRARSSRTLKTVLATLKDAGIPLDETNVGSEASEAERELILMLKALDNPRSDISFAGYLLSYFGGYTEDELTAISAYPGRCFYDKFVAAGKGDPSLAGKIGATLATLDEYRLKAGFKSVGELMHSIVCDSMYDAYMHSKGDGNLAELKNFIASTDEVSLGKFLDEYRKGEERAVSASSNSVKISTIHKFKGLESPVVFVLDATGDIKEPTDEVIFSKNGDVGLKYYDLENKTTSETFSRFALKKLEKAEKTKDEMRLLYVALTRAKQLMYITECVPSKYVFGARPSFMGIKNTGEFLSAARFKKSLSQEVEDFSVAIDPVAVRHAPVMNSTPDPDLLDEVGKARSKEYAHAAATKLAMKYSVSQIGGLDDNSADLFADGDRSAARMGTAYHKVMQNVDFASSSPEDIKEQLAHMREEGALTDDEVALVDPAAIVACLSSDIMRVALKEEGRGNCEREKPFTMLKSARELKLADVDDKVLVQGVIDLYIKGEKRIIVDFKTGDLRRGNVPERYKRQLELYKMAVEAAENVKVDKILLYSFKTGETLEI